MRRSNERGKESGFDFARMLVGGLFLGSLDTLLSQTLFEKGHEVQEGRAEGAAEGAKLDDVKAALADFHLADQRLALVKAFGKLEPASGPLFAELPGAPPAARHIRRCRSTCPCTPL